MKVVRDMEYRKVLVCGMGRSGQWAVQLLCSLGAKVTAQDMKEDVELIPGIYEGVDFYFGKNPISYFLPVSN